MIVEPIVFVLFLKRSSNSVDAQHVCFFYCDASLFMLEFYMSKWVGVGG